jgi:hypothetical protein
VGLGEEDLGFGFDDEEGVGGGVAARVELLDGVVESGSEDGEDYGAIVAADEVEAAFLLDELEVWWHVGDVLEHVDALRQSRPRSPV